MKSLHNHSMFSLHDSVVTPDALVKQAKKMGITDITLTDHGTLLGIDDFMAAGKKYGINTIPGVEAYIPEHCIIVAKNYNGYRMISKAVRDSNEHFEEIKKKKKPIMSEEILKKYFTGNKDVIITTACIGGPIAKILLHNERIKKQEKKYYNELKKIHWSNEEELNIEQKIKETNLHIEQLKQENKMQVGYTKKPYQNQIERRKRQSKQLSMFKEETVKDMEFKRNLAFEIINKNNNLINDFKKNLAQLKENLQKIKKTKGTYYGLIQKIKELPYQSEEEIVYLAKSKLEDYKACFPNFFVELQYHGIDSEAFVMPILAKLARECSIPVIAANDAHMLMSSEDDLKARQIVRYNYFSKHSQMQESDKELYLKNEEELRSSLRKILPEDIVEESIQNLDILSECKVVFPHEKHYPKIKGNVSFDKLILEKKQKMIQEGEWDEEHEKRLSYEVKTIKSMGYVDYHLVVRDFCIVAKKLGNIPKSEIKNVPVDFNKVFAWIEKKGFKVGVGVGPGRGSAVGSLVCYMLGITNIDPIKYNLLFERFLNPERVSMPDIDSDIATRLRPLLIQYLKWFYGEKAVCSIMTKTTYGAKNALLMAIRDRKSELFSDKEPKKKDFLHMEKDKAEIFYENAKQKYNRDIFEFQCLTNKLGKLIPDKAGISLENCRDAFMSNSDPEALTIYHNACLIENVLSGTSIHAGGIVISDNKDINEYVPLSLNYDEKKQIWVWATQCDMIQVEEKGLLKMDLLGLNTLDVISECIQMVYKQKGLIIDLDHLPLEKEVFREIYAKGYTNSVFQFESDGMKKFLTQFRPECFEDIILLVACYRPGPMQYLDDIIAVKNGQKNITYEIPILKDILNTTYGAIVYQEQVMQIFQKLAGYSLGGADMVRRAMSKKKAKKLAYEREAFLYGDKSRKIKGCIANGIPEKAANKIFDELMDFAKYAFNKSHAAAYAMVSYQTAYLKYHFPEEFLCAMFNNVASDKIYPLLEDCKLFHISLLPPDINRSFYDFTLEENGLRFGFRGISGIGEKNSSIQNIVNNRSGYVTEWPYASFQEFFIRNAQEKCADNGTKTVNIPNKKILEGLIYAGCFDKFNKNREDLYKIYQGIVENLTKQPLRDFIFNMKQKVILPGTADHKNNCKNELKYLGMIISHNPLLSYQKENAYGCSTVLEMKENGHGYLMGLVIKSEQKKTKTYRDMQILTINTRQDTIEVLFFDEDARNNNSQYEGEVIKIYCDYNNNTYFGKDVQILNPEVHKYYLDITTLEQFEQVSHIIRNSTKKEDAQNILYLRSRYHKGKKLDIPHLYEPIKISNSAVDQLQATILD